MEGTCESEKGQLLRKISALERKVSELQDFAIWMTGCGYDFASLPYFREQRDKLLLNAKEEE
jgi:hypothetical protein